jgi:hypothetical protein
MRLLAILCLLAGCSDSMIEMQQPPPSQPGVDAAAADAAANPDAAALEHDFFATAYVEESDTYNVPSDGDLWANCWSDDDALYVANGDGKGFSNTFGDIVVSRITGSAFDRSLAGTTLASGDQVASIWNPSNYNRKPTGMVCVGGDLYLAVQDLRTSTFDDAPAATIVRSTDKGHTWTWDHSAPMFSDHVFTTIFFLDYGKAGAHAMDSYVYAYGLDGNWAFTGRVTPPTKLYLARVPHDRIQDRASWEFFTGSGWSSDIAARQAVLDDERRVYTAPINVNVQPQGMTVLAQGSVVYNAPLNRYLYTSWTEYTFEFYEAPAPWGPWKRFLSKDYGVYPWFDDKNGGYATTIPSKFISDDGRTMFVQANTWSGGIANYGFSLRKLTVAPWMDATPQNGRSADPIPGGVPFVRALHYGRGALDSDDDSWTGEAKTEDWWGFIWATPVNLNTLVYTTGTTFPDGGWFDDVRVEIRRGSQWIAASNIQVTPAYAHDASIAAHTTFTFGFDEIWGDGVRLVGTPGGPSHFTTLSALAAFDR